MGNEPIKINLWTEYPEENSDWLKLIDNGRYRKRDLFVHDELAAKGDNRLIRAKRLKHLPGQHDQMTHGGSGLPMKTAGANLQTGYAGMREGFNLTSPHGKAQGYLYDADFPGDRSSRTRGELFYVEVARGSQGRGHGRSLAEDSLRAMLNHGAKTVNMSAVTDAGRGLIKALERDGVIRFIRGSDTGKAEYEINQEELE